MVDRVKPLKLESSDSGGGDEDDFPTSLNKNEDHIDCRGITVQNDSSDNESVIISRDASDNMTFADGVVSGTKTLADLLAGGRSDKVRQFYDFVGTAIDSNIWATYAGGAGSTISLDASKHYGEVVLEGDASGAAIYIASGTGASYMLNVADNFTLEFRAKATDSTNQAQLGSSYDGSNLIAFYTASGTWRVITKSSGTSTDTSTGVTQDGEYHTFKIIATSSSVKFYIDGGSEVIHTTNITTQDMFMHVSFDLFQAGQAYFYCDWIEYMCDKYKMPKEIK